MKTATPQPERLISMIGPLVLATIAGTKTETRRVMHPQPKARPFQVHGERTGDWFTANPAYPRHGAMMNGRWRCPYGQPGDVLAVREAAWMWCERRPNGQTPTGRMKYRYVPVESVPPVYCADHPKKPEPGEGWIAHEKRNEHSCVWRYKGPRYLPRWAVRLRVRIVGIGVERVQDISEAAAMAEGMERCGGLWRGINGVPARKTAYAAFAEVWEAINAERGFGWDSNPWVFVIQYKKESA